MLDGPAEIPDWYIKDDVPLPHSKWTDWLNELEVAVLEHRRNVAQLQRLTLGASHVGSYSEEDRSEVYFLFSISMRTLQEEYAIELEEISARHHI